MRSVLISAFLLFISNGIALAQTNGERVASTGAESLTTVTLGVPAGTPLPVVLDNEIRIQKAGQAIRGKIAEPVYAFDKLVIPAGSEVSGSVTRIARVSALKRVRAALDSDFSPARDVQITFDQLSLPDGRRIPLRTEVSPASQGVLQFAIASDIKEEGKPKKGNAAKKLAEQKISEKKQEISREWQTAKEQIKAPGKLHRLKRLALAELSIHPQYLDTGTRFNAELLDPLSFGSEEISSEGTRMVGSPPADGSIVHALLRTPLDSASSQNGDQVEAVITSPLVTDGNLVLPEGTVIRGSVLQAQPARKFHRNGQMRLVFHEIVPPGAAGQHVEASLEGVEVKGDQHLSLDSEGGARATSPKTRYLSAGLSLTVAGFSSDDLVNRIFDGGSAYNFIGLAVGGLVRSRNFAIACGALGATRSVYSNFISRGRDVVYPKGTAMAIGFGSRVTSAPKAGASNSQSADAKAVLASTNSD